MEQNKELSVTLDDRPGTLARATGAIAKAGNQHRGLLRGPVRQRDGHLPHHYEGPFEHTQGARDRRVRGAGGA